MSRLSLENVSISAGSTVLLSNCTAEFSADGLTVIFGRSGSGKTTLLKALCHLRPFNGSITLDGKDICSLPPTLVRQQIQYLHQEPYLFPGSVRENLQQLKEYRQHHSLQLSETNLIAQLQRVGLPADLLDRPAELLSGGEKQRLCIVRSLLIEPQFLLLDEPSSALDIATEADLILLLKTLSKQIGIIAVSHSVSFIQAADRALLLRPDGLQQLPLPLKKPRILELVENGTTDS